MFHPEVSLFIKRVIKHVAEKKYEMNSLKSKISCSAFNWFIFVSAS